MKKQPWIGAVSVVVLAACAGRGWAQVTYLAEAVIPGGPAAAADDSGLPHTLLEDGITYQDRFDGFGSGMAYTGFGDVFLLLSDRGPNKNAYTGGAAVDNTTSYLNRFQVANITLTDTGSGSYSVGVSLLHTSMLKNAAGQNYVGISTAFTGADATHNLRLDPEGIAVHPDGTVYISDEYGPVIYHFSQSGQLLNSVAVPAKFEIANPAPKVSTEITGNTSGRVGNKGMEGLTISPSGKVMVGAMQSPLLQDAPVSGTASTGTNIRFLKYDLTDPTAIPAPQEYVYQLDNPAYLVSEILAVNDHQFLVDERDGLSTSTSAKLLYLIDFNQASAPTDVSGIANLSATGNTPGVTALSKTLFANVGQILRDAGAIPATNGGTPDKFEGYAFGPDLPDGRHTLLATNDNDYSTTFGNYVWAFAIDKDYFSDYQVRQLNSGVTFIPEPATLGLLVLGGASLLGRRRAR